MVSLLLLSSSALLIKPIAEIPTRIAIDYNEGWNAYQAKRALDGNPLYPPYNSLTSNNYPPLSFYVIGKIGASFGDNVIAGRIVAVTSLFLVAIFIALTIRTLGGSIKIGGIASIFFIGFMAAYHDYYVSQNDPQWLGHALMIFGLFLFLKSRQHGALLYISVLFMVLAGMVKHNIIPLPLAVFTWLIIYNRPVFIRWTLFSLALLLIFLLLFYAVYGEDFLRGLFMDARVMNLWRAKLNVVKYFTPLIPIIFLCIVDVVFFPSTNQNILPLYYVLYSALWGIITLSGAGVDRNAIFDVIIALTIVLGLLLHKLSVGLKWSKDTGKRLESCVIFIFILSVSFNINSKLISTKEFLQNRLQHEATTASDVAFIAQKKGPAMCENLALCYWGGKNFEVDYFNAGQKIEAGLVDSEILVSLLKNRYFASIQMDSRNAISYRFPAIINEAIAANYKIQRFSESNGVFLVPKDRE